MMNADPHSAPSALTPTRPAVDVTHVPQEGMRKPVQRRNNRPGDVRSQSRRSSSPCQSESLTLPFWSRANFW